MKRKNIIRTLHFTLSVSIFIAVPLFAVEVNGVLGSASATTTIDGKQIPAPDPEGLNEENRE